MPVYYWVDKWDTHISCIVITVPAIHPMVGEWYILRCKVNYDAMKRFKRGRLMYRG